MELSILLSAVIVGWVFLMRALLAIMDNAAHNKENDHDKK